MARIRTVLKRAGQLGVIGGGAVVAAGSVPSQDNFALTALQNVFRFSYTVSVASYTVFDYKTSLLNIAKDSDEYKQTRSECHHRAASRILAVCRHNGGLYTKAGQHLASLSHVLPKEFTSTLSVLQDQAASRSFDDVQSVFQGSLEKDLLDEFKEFDRTPIGSASLAQVHRAVRKDGREVAVKVQYPGLYPQAMSDLFTFKVVLMGLEFVYDGLELLWLLPEFKGYILEELNFAGEAGNAEEARRNFEDNPSVKIPEIHWDMTCSKVLTMEFCRGIKPNNADELAAAGHDLKRVSSLIVSSFAEQIFKHGFVHGDPHAGNMLVRHDDRGETQLVILDHGLYQRLDQEFRHNYCRLWTSIYTNDVEHMKVYTRRMGVDESFYKLLVLSMSQRPVLEGDMGMKKEVTRKDIQELVAEMRGYSLEQTSAYMKSVPKDLYVVLKTHNLIRAAVKDLSGSNSSIMALNRFKIFADYALKGIYMENSLANEPSEDISKVPMANRMRAQMMIWMMELMVWIGEWPMMSLTLRPVLRRLMSSNNKVDRSAIM